MKALTGNRLDDGVAVFWKSGQWIERFVDGDLFDDEVIAQAAEAQAKSDVTRIVDPYLIDVVPADDTGGLAPLSYRERLRALGPTNKSDHGKQAAGGHDIDVLMHASGASRSTGRVNLIKRK